jgi:hypothetical protein
VKLGLALGSTAAVNVDVNVLDIKSGESPKKEIYISRSTNIELSSLRFSSIACTISRKRNFQSSLKVIA